MARGARLRRTSVFLDPVALRKARRALGVATDAEAVRASLARVGEMDEFWRFMARTRGRLKRGTFRRP